MLTGALVHWAGSVLLIGVFALFKPLSTRPRSTALWMRVWVLQVLAVVYSAAGSLRLFTGLPLFYAAVVLLGPLHWAAQYAFLAALVLASLDIAGFNFRAALSVGIVTLAALAGLALVALQLEGLAQDVELIATPLLMFGTAHYVFRAANGNRRRGLLLFGAVLSVFGLLKALYLFEQFQLGPGLFSRLVHTLYLTAGYGDALILFLLATAVVFVIMQESFLDAASAHEARLAGIASSESRLTSIIQAAQEAILTVDAAGQIELANAAAGALFRAPSSALVNSDIGVYLNKAAVLAHDGRAIDVDGRFTTHESPAQRADGTRFHAEFTVGNLRNENAAGFVVVVRDLTDRDAATAKREEFERHMADSEKMLAIGRVVSGVAHELNNPLAVVLGQSEQLADSVAAGEVRNSLQLIVHEATRARHIVRDLLAFVRETPGRREPTDVGAIVERVATLQRAVAGPREITIRTVLDPALPGAMADAGAVEQVIVNLLDNAVDAATSRVTVSASIDGTRLRVVVEDDGLGIGPDIADKVFEPFFSTKGPGRGTGLGLTVSQRIAEQQGGSLELERLGAGAGGTRFVLWLPVTAVGRKPRGATTSSVTPFPAPPRRPDGQPAEVMLIDDEEAVRLTLAKMFKRAGWPVREAEDGDVALAWLVTVPEELAPVVILCDLKMPRVSGRAVYEQLAALRPWLAARIVFVTGDVVQSASNGFIAASGCAVVEKPFTITEIAQAVEASINSQ
jgi:PAS domain S-box-containing protein